MAEAMQPVTLQRQRSVARGAFKHPARSEGWVSRRLGKTGVIDFKATVPSSASCDTPHIPEGTHARATKVPR